MDEESIGGIVIPKGIPRLLD
jgi:hypothetical protein